MGYSARVLLDSISPAGARLVTMEVRYPRIVHAEMMTHRVFSRNAGSSRAIPIKRMIAAVREESAMPIYWGKNQVGMSAAQELDEDARGRAEVEWRRALDNALESAERLSDSSIGLHKQLVNRILEPFSWITVIITATEWGNFFTQRCHPDAQPEIRHIADLMLQAFNGSEPVEVRAKEWHLPLIAPDERDQDVAVLRKVSVARCARVSYLTHDGVRDQSKDIDLFDKLLDGGANGHWSPFEHVATPLDDATQWCANFRGWLAFRKLFATENAPDYPAMKRAQAPKGEERLLASKQEASLTVHRRGDE
jgi:thymidylate synthase ThyX